MILSPEGLEEIAQRLARQNNLPIETARKYANLIGDTPELADDGRIIVIDRDGNELARVIMQREDAASRAA